MPGVHEFDFLTNSSMMSVDFLPKHLIVVGGSYIGLEFGQMFRRFGAEVTIIEMGPREGSPAASTATTTRSHPGHSEAATC